MSEFFESLGPVEWFREQFEQCPQGVTDCDSISAQELFQWVLIAWLVAAVVLIALDRLGSGLFGRSRPLAQVPPTQARTWRWRRQTPPANYSLLPPGTTLPAPVPAPSIVLETVARPELTTGTGSRTDTHDVPIAGAPPRASSSHLIASTLTDAELWRAYSKDPVPMFGLENQTRLADGRAPERYNPVSGRVESMLRDSGSAALLWPVAPRSVAVIGSLETDEEPGEEE